ncbi:MAG: hypothetical protein KGJ89_00175 [Patescibacteria group bacterium]|nr:hypothetical protein [Patescibacteria group bacterium]MDE2014937.1 hypothetical protein [Patescibacteria group bacterium]MDE2226366.1 hypothetical protein [Patescibacteria group bacterium]
MKTITDLNNKMWYRFLKVFYILLIFVVITITIMIGWSDTSYTPFDPSQFGAIPVQPKDLGYLPVDTSAPNINQLSPSDYTTAQKSNGLMQFLGEVVPILIVELLLFEFARRAFYYIVLGTWRPKR